MPAWNTPWLALPLSLAGAPLFTAACGAAPGHDPSDAPGRTAVAQATWRGVEPEALPERLGFGRAPTADEIAALDIDVTPDGRGLPPGRGTVAEGARVYAAQCAACHGPAGEGVPQVGNRLVGREPIDSTGWNRTIGNFWPFAPTLFDYLRRTMPFDRPGSLADDEVYAVTAYLLHLNELIPEDVVMDRSTLPQVEMPARDLFTPDDRETSTRVR